MSAPSLASIIYWRMSHTGSEMEENLPPPYAEDNIFDQFDVQVTGELLSGGTRTADGPYFCRLPPCRGKKRVFGRKRGLIGHRRTIHCLPNTGTHKIPEDDQIRQWVRSGKPGPYESPERMKLRDRPAGSPGSSLLSKLQQRKPVTESELEPATLVSNIYEQFDVREEPGEAGGVPYVGFVCLLSQCHEEKVCFNTYAKWTRHRMRVHKETEEVQCVMVPDGYEIREWVKLNKPRPYEVPVKSRAFKKVKLCPVDPDVFAEFDVKGKVEDNEQLLFFCLLPPCKGRGKAYQGHRSWRHHRCQHHMSPRYEDAGGNGLPSEEIVMDWMSAGKPPNYETQRRVRTFIYVDPPSPSAELHNREVDSIPANVVCNDVGNDVNSGGEESRKSRSRNQYSQVHHQELQLEGRASLRRSKNLARLGKFRPSTPQTEIPKESSRRGRRPRNADAAGCSSDTEHAHQKKKKRHSMRSTNRSDSTDSSDSDSSDLVGVRVIARGEVPSGGLRIQLMEKDNTTRDETPPSEDSEEESDDSIENVDELSVDQTVEDPNHDDNSADMEEFGEEPREDALARPEEALPSLPYSQTKSHDSGAAEVAEVNEDAHEEFEAPDNTLPPQPELQNVTEIVGHSCVQPQYFQGVTNEHQQNSTAEITKAGEEASEEFEAPDNVLPSQPEFQNTKVVGHSGVQPQDFLGVTVEHEQNSTAEMADEETPKDSVASENVLPSLQNSIEEAAETGEVEEEEPEDFVAPESALTALTYSQPILWEHSSVQPQEFLGDLVETLPNSTAEMDEDEEEAPEDSVATENVQSSLACLQQEFVKHRSALPQEFLEQMFTDLQTAEFGEAHEEPFINPWTLNPSVQSDVSEQIALSPLRHLDGDTFQSLPQEFSGENWPSSSNEDNLKYSAEMAELGEEAPEEIVAVGNLSLSAQSETSEQNSLSTFRHYFKDALQFAPEESVGESNNYRPNSNTEMAEVGEEALEGFVTPENLTPLVPLMQSEGTEVPSLRGPIDIQVVPIQESVPRVHMEQVFTIGPNAAGMDEVGEDAPEGFVTPWNFLPWIPLIQTEGAKVQILEGPINIQVVPIQESVPRVHMDPAFIIEQHAAWMNDVGVEALEGCVTPGNLVPLLPSNAHQGCVTPGNLVPLLPSNAHQETGQSFYVSSLNTNASSQDPRNFLFEHIIHEYPWIAESVNTGIASMNELAVMVPFAPSTQSEGREIGSVFMEGSAENQVDPIPELTTLPMDVGKPFQSEPDLPLINDRIENPEEFHRLDAMALSPYPMQQLFSSGNSEASNIFSAFPVLPTDPPIVWTQAWNMN